MVGTKRHFPMGDIMSQNNTKSQKNASPPPVSPGNRVVAIDVQSPEGELLELYCYERDDWLATYKPRIEEMQYAVVGMSFEDTPGGREHLRERFSESSMAAFNASQVSKEDEKEDDENVVLELQEVPEKTEEIEEVAAYSSASQARYEKQTEVKEAPKRQASENRASNSVSDTGKSRKQPVSAPTKSLKATKPLQVVQKTTETDTVHPVWQNPADERTREVTQVIRRINEAGNKGFAAKMPLPLRLFTSFWISPKSFAREVQARLGVGKKWEISLLFLLALAGIPLMLGGVAFNPELFVYLQISPLTASLPVSDFLHWSMAHPWPVIVDQVVTILALSVVFHILLSVLGNTTPALVTFLLVGLARSMYLVTVVGLAWFVDSYSLGFQLVVILTLGMLGLWKLARAFVNGLDVQINKLFVSVFVFALVVAASVPMATTSLPWQQLKESLFRNSGLQGNLDMVKTLIQASRNTENRQRLETALVSQRDSITDLGLENYLPLNLNAEHIGELLDAYDSETAKARQKELQEMLGYVEGLTDDRSPEGWQADLPVEEGTNKLLALLEERHPELKKDYETLMASSQGMQKRQAKNALVEKILALDDLQGFRPATMKVIGVIVMGNNIDAGQKGAFQFSLCKTVSDRGTRNVGTPSKVLWNFDYRYEGFIADREAGLSESVEHRWTVPGKYIVAARIITDSGALSQIVTQNVVVKPVLKLQTERLVVFSLDDQPLEMQWSFVQQKGNPDEYTLEIDKNFRKFFTTDLSVSNQLTANIAPEKEGVFTVAARVRLPDGKVGDVERITLVSGVESVKRWIERQGPFTAGQPATIYPLVDANTDFVDWDLDYRNGIFTKNEQTMAQEALTHVFRYPGTYSLATRTGGSPDVHSFSIRVKEAEPEVSIREWSLGRNDPSKKIALTAECSGSKKRGDFSLQWDTSYDGRTFQGEKQWTSKEPLTVERPDRGEKLIAARCVDSDGVEGPLNLYRVAACPMF